jgi:hypothetical protein
MAGGGVAGEGARVVSDRVTAVARSRRRTVLAAGLLLSTFALPVLAAGLLAVDDPNDTAGLLDVHEVRFFDGDGPPAWTVITFNDWTLRQLWDRGYVLLYLDTLGSPDPDYYVLVRADRRSLVGVLWRIRADGHDVNLFKVATRKRGGDGVRVSVPLRRLSIGDHRTLYRWSVLTLFTGNHCRRTCLDPAPDATMVEQPLPTGSPRRTPT